jgi:TonB family protein
VPAIRSARSRGAGLALTLALISHHAAGAADTPLPDAAAVPGVPAPGEAEHSVPRLEAGIEQLRRLDLASVQQLDAALEQLHRGVWMMYSVPQPQAAPGAATHAQEIDQWLMTPQREARLRELRARAQRQAARGEDAALSATLGEAAGLIVQERYRMYALSHVWWLRDLIASHAANLQTLEAREPPEASRARQSRIASAEAAMNDALRSGMAADSRAAQAAASQQLQSTGIQALHTYNTERARLAEELSAQERAQGRQSPARARDTPCPAAVTRTSGSERPGIAAANAAPASFYPAASRRAQFEGQAVIEAWVSAGGCAERAEVYVSSGVPEIDAAAIAWTQQAKFYPAERDQHPVGGTLRFAVRFTLKD